MNRSTSRKPRRVVSWWTRPLWTPSEYALTCIAVAVIGYCVGRMW